MYTEFKIKELTSWAVVEFSTGERRFEFWASKLCPDSFNQLMDALAKIVQDKSTSAAVLFDLEAEGSLRIFFTRYVWPDSSSLLKVEIYTDINWFAYDDEFEELPMPKPRFECLIVYDAYFAYNVLKEIKRHGKDAFYCWNNDVWDEKVLALEVALKNDPYFIRPPKIT